jgi:hypothetical protein
MATIHDLIDFFSSFTVLPIDPDDVADQIKSYGIKDEIEFVWVSLDVLIIRGALHHHISRPGLYADPVVCADIYIDKDQPSDWRRLVAIKELLHLFDHSKNQTATAFDCEKLIDGLASIRSAKSFLDVKALQAWADYLMLYYAISVAFPEAVRELFYDDYKAGHISVADVRHRIDLPEEVIRLVMSDTWPPILKEIVGRK